LPDGLTSPNSRLAIAGALLLAAVPGLQHRPDPVDPGHLHRTAGRQHHNGAGAGGRDGGDEGVAALATHREALARFPFDTVLSPLNYVLGHDPADLAEAEAVLAAADDYSSPFINIPI
jgi:hypothetical protein